MVVTREGKGKWEGKGVNLNIIGDVMSKKKGSLKMNKTRTSGI